LFFQGSRWRCAACGAEEYGSALLPYSVGPAPAPPTGKCPQCGEEACAIWKASTPKANGSINVEALQAAHAERARREVEEVFRLDAEANPVNAAARAAGVLAAFEKTTPNAKSARSLLDMLNVLDTDTLDISDLEMKTNRSDTEEALFVFGRLRGTPLP